MMRHVSTVLWWTFGVAAVVFMLAPLVLLVVFSFSASSNMTVPITGWSLRWYETVFDTPQFWSALRNSVIIGLSVGLVSTVVGTMAALAAAQMRPAVAGALMLLLSLPVMLPPLVLSLSLRTLVVTTDNTLGLHAVIVGHLVYTQPFVALIVYARMSNFDRAIIDSASDLGAGPWTIFRTVVLPIIRPTVIGAGLIAMALSLDDFVITLFNIGGGNTLPTYMWGMLRRGVTPGINVVGIVLVALIVLASLIALRVTRYRG